MGQTTSVKRVKRKLGLLSDWDRCQTPPTCNVLLNLPCPGSDLLLFLLLLLLLLPPSITCRFLQLYRPPAYQAPHCCRPPSYNSNNNINSTTSPLPPSPATSPTSPQKKRTASKPTGTQSTSTTVGSTKRK